MAGDSCGRTQPNGGSGHKDPDSSQLSPEPPRSTTNTSPTYGLSSQCDPPSLTPHSTAEGHMELQKASQRANPAPFSAPRPLVELPSFTIRNKYSTKTMSSAAIKTRPALGITVSNFVTSPQQHTSTSSATSLKSILRSSSCSTGIGSQGRPQRKKSVRFALDLESNEPGVGAVVNAVKWLRRLPSQPPPATRSTSPLPHYLQRLSSSASKAGSQSKEVQARLTRGAKGRNGSDTNKQRAQRPQAKVQPQPKHQILNMENLAILSHQIGTGGRQGDGVSDDGDDEDNTASNTDFELAVRMKRRWI